MCGCVGVGGCVCVWVAGCGCVLLCVGVCYYLLVCATVGIYIGVWMGVLYLWFNFYKGIFVLVSGSVCYICGLIFIREFCKASKSDPSSMK